MKEAEEERNPDLYYNDRLLSTPYDQDDELHKIIIQSRNEYLEQERKMHQKKEEKRNLQKRLAIPISRLYLWKKTSTNQDEITCLDLILNLLYIRTTPDRDDDDATIPEEHMDKVRSFLVQYLEKPPLFREVYQICMEVYQSD